RCDEYRVLVHAENGHPVRVIGSQCVSLVNGADGIGEGTAARDDEEGVLARETVQAGKCTRQRVLECEERASNLDDGVNRVRVHEAGSSQHSRSRATENAASAPAARAA